jgi:hypothetical protein
MGIFYGIFQTSQIRNNLQQNIVDRNFYEFTVNKSENE